MTQIIGSPAKPAVKMNRQQRRQTGRQAKVARNTATSFGAGAPADVAPVKTLAIAAEHHRAGHLDMAETLYRRVLEQFPEQVNALHLLGLIAHQKGQNENARELIGSAIAIDPNYAEAHSNIGSTLIDLEAYDEAVTHIERALSIKPGMAEAHNNLGTALHRRGDLAKANESFRRAIVLNPNYAKAYKHLGVVLAEQGDLDQALACFQRSIALDSSDPQAYVLLGDLFMLLKKDGQAEAVYKHVTTIEPDNANAHFQCGVLAERGRRFEEAIVNYRRTIEIQPDFTSAHNNLGVMLLRTGALEEALTSTHHALALNPNSLEAHNNVAVILQNLGELDAACEAYRTTMVLAPDFAKTHSNLIFALNLGAKHTPEEILAESREWNAKHAAPRAARARPCANTPDPERRLRIGYVSPDFRSHSVSYFFEPLLTNHDRDAVEIFCYAEIPRPDAITARLQALADHWCFTVDLTDAELADRIREDRIDVLVDLAGHTANNRLLAFAERPAPVQVTWLGYGATTGMTEMDYYLTDAVADPVEEAGRFFSETLVRLPHTFVCYVPPVEAPEVAPLPALSNGHVTFGTFNNPSKIGPEVIEVWAQVLREFPGSRLLMKSSQLRDESLCEKFRTQFAAHGIAGERIEFMPKIPAMSDHLAAYGRVDIAFDSFPYNGGTTSLEAAWMGAPMIALRGDRFVSRMGASILTQLGLTDLVAESPQAYVEIATNLAKDLDRLASLRSDLRPRMAASPLCDVQSFAQNMEAAFRQMWRRWCSTEVDHE